MESQRNRQQFQKDLESKDDEIEQAKLDQQRKVVIFRYSVCRSEQSCEYPGLAEGVLEPT